MGLSCWLDREMKKGDNVHLYQCESTRAPGFITDIKQRKQKYIYIYMCVRVCIFFLISDSMRETNFTSSSKCPEFSSTWYKPRAMV